MRHRWRAEDDPRERHSHHQPRDRDRDWDRDARRPHSPHPENRGGDSFASRDQGNPRENRPHPRKRHNSRDRNSRKFKGRKPSPPPSHPSKSRRHHPAFRPDFENRPSRHLDQSPTRAAKRRRTQSPSPSGSARLGSDPQRPGRSRESPDPDDRHLPASSSRSPPRDFPPQSPRPTSSAARSQISRRDRHGPTGHRDHSPFRTHNNRSISPRPLSRASPPRRPESKISITDTPISSVNSLPLKTRRLPGEPKPSAKQDNPPSRPPSVVDDTETRSMDGQYPPHRGNYGMHRGQQRPFVDTRQQGYGGSPPYSSNSSYHGSPQATSPYHNQRGGWGGHG